MYSCGHIYLKCLFNPAHFSPRIVIGCIILVAAVTDLHTCISNIHLFIIITKMSCFFGRKH